MNPEEYTVIDIETYPNKEMIDRLPEPTVKYGNTNDKEKRQAKYEKVVLKQVDDMALSPLYGKIACIGYTDENGDEQCYISENEIEIINFIFEKIISYKESASPKLVTWDGNRFDIPFIYKRALILGVETHSELSYWTKRYQVNPHCDLAQVWCNWDSNKYEKLDNVSNAVLGYGKVEFDVTTIKDLIKTEEGRGAIAKYCMQDVEITSKLFYKMANVLF